MKKQKAEEHREEKSISLGSPKYQGLRRLRVTTTF